LAKRSFVLGCVVGSSLTAIALLGVSLQAQRSVVRAELGRDGRMAPVSLGVTEPTRAHDTLLTRAELSAGDDASLRCPVTGKTGHSTLSLEEVMKRAHGDTRGSGCPYVARTRNGSQCPHRGADGASVRQSGGVWL